MLGRKKSKLGEDDLYSYAVRLLGGRALSAGEIRAKMRQRAAEDADVDRVVLKLKEYGFLNDERFAEGYATARRDNQGFGHFRVLQDLRKRRVAPAVAEKTAAAAFSEVDESEQAARYLERKYRGKDLPTFLAEEKNAAAAYRRLRAAGFGSGAAIRVLKRYTVRADELEDTETASDPENDG